MNTLEIITALKKNNVVPRLAGEQLKLVGDTKNLPEQLIEQIRDRKDELRAFLRDAMDQHAFTAIPAVPEQADYPSSNAQKRIWVLSRMEGGSSAYNIVRSFYLKGVVIEEYLNKAFQLAIRRHESLRTVFREVAAELRQVVLKNIDFSVNIKGAMTADADQSASWQFDLEKGPLLRVDLYRIAEQEYAMIFGVHHIVSDGWSIGVLVPEIMGAYESYCKGNDPEQAPLSIQYKDYCVWHEQRMAGEKGIQAMHFWESQFLEAQEPLSLSADAARPAIRSFEGAIARFYPDDQFYAGIHDFCAKHHITSFNFFRASLLLLLSRLSGQHDITIGVPASGRNHLDLERQIGLYVNTLPLRAQLDMEESFSDFLKRITEHSYRAFEFQDYPFDRIIEGLGLRRDISRNPLFDVMLVVQDAAVGEGSVNKHHQFGFELNLLDKYLHPSGRKVHEKAPAKFDLTFNLDFEPDNRFYIEIEYDARLFAAARIDRIFRSWLHVMEQCMQSPDMLLSAVEPVPPAEKNTLLQTFNQPVAAIEEYSISQLLESSFTGYTKEAAIVVKDKAVSYTSLAAVSGHIAAHLYNLATESDLCRVGLLMGRSEQVIFSITGVLKAGLAYVPIDITYPSSRIAYIAADAQLSLIIVDDEGQQVIPATYTGRIIHINELTTACTALIPDRDLREQTAYVIYTSGSTGQPKGVEICHRNTIAFLKWAAREFFSTSFDVLYATSSYCFDLSVFEFLFPLMEGKTVRILASATEIAVRSGEDKKIMLNTVPSVVRSLLDTGMDWRNITALNMAGEPVPQSFKTALDYSRMEVRNLYGPTEDTTYSTVYRFAEDTYTTIPIGVPVGDTQLYIMDATQHLLPIGFEGEIFLSGQSVAKGYLHREALTAEKFLKNPFLPDQVMYKTGDLGRWTEDGKVLFGGRIDDQLKIRGYRIEPGEIRFRLEQHPAVRQAVVVVRRVGEEDAIVAYVLGDVSLNPAILKKYLSESLPAYMLPGFWVQLDEMPLNSNGKVDTKRLPLPPEMEQSSSSVALTPLQRQLQALWSQVLGNGEPAVTDNFFDRGGHSLKAAKLQFLIEKELGKGITLNEIFTAATIEMQAQLLESKTAVHIASIPLTDEQQLYPISAAQERLWVLTKFEEASVAYNMPAVYRIRGKLDLSRLEHAFRLVIEKYEILRTVFTEKEGMPLQQVLENIDFSISEIQTHSSWQQKPFDLEKGPLLRCAVLHKEEEDLLFFDMHHMISDGWSLEILFQNIAAAYHSQADKLAAPEIQYKDFAVWQRSQPAGSQQFWLDMFKGEVPVAELPFDFKRPAVKTYNGAVSYTSFSSAGLKSLARQADASLFMVMMAIVRIFLKKYAGRPDIVIGTPVSGRIHRQLQDQIGFYVNTLPVRLQVNSTDTFLTTLEKEKNMLLAALENQDFSFEKLIEELQLSRDLSRSPLFDVMLVLQHEGEPGTNAVNYLTADLALERVSMATAVAKYDLVFSFLEETDRLSLSLEYNTDLFMEETIQRMMRHLNSVIEQLTAMPEIQIRDLVLPDKEELALLASKADQTRFSYDPAATLVSLFQEMVNRYPDKPALIAGNNSITYRELDTKSGQLAKILICDYGVQTEDLVMLHMERNEWMIIGILAVLKAGAAYVPLDPDAPAARTAYMRADCGGRLILSDTTLEEDIAVNITLLHYTGDSAQIAVQPSSLAYVIYTSGTTGNPKGVLIEHRQLTRLFFHEGNLFNFCADDRWSLFHSYCFDFSVWEMYGALLHGGTLVIVPKHIAQDGRSFYDFLQEQKISVLNQTPTAFRSMLQVNEGRLETLWSLRYLIFGGEALLPVILEPFIQTTPQCRIINMYGITETTVHVTYKEITGDEITLNKSNIGLPIPTVSCYVLDEDLQEVPLGVTGELCVGGAGVARGYLNRPELNAAKFINRNGLKMYRSGDYARILSNGDLEYIGRRDDQVKIRGHRIELAEVEAAIIAQAGIKDAVVLPVKNGQGEYELAAWFIPVEGASLLRKELAALLPVYMLPSYLIPLKDFPLNNNGKLDKNALPDPLASTHEGILHVSSRNKTDEIILSIWETVLERKGISIKDNFFDLGGHSLKATRIVSKVHELTGVKVDLKALFMDPTIAHLSDYVETLRWMDVSREMTESDQGEIVF